MPVNSCTRSLKYFSLQNQPVLSSYLATSSEAYPAISLFPGVSSVVGISLVRACCSGAVAPVHGKSYPLLIGSLEVFGKTEGFPQSSLLEIPLSWFRRELGCCRT